MLKELYIQDFALIDELRINFVSGFNVFTGETGAGKSIIMDALSFVLGKRADRSFIRKEKQRSTIEAVFFFSAENQRLADFFEGEGLDFNEGTIFLRREIYDDGHSTSRINGRMVTISILKKLASGLLSLHEQNEFDEIMLKENQLSVLDEFIGMNAEHCYLEYDRRYREYRELKKQLRELEESYITSDVNRELDILAYQIREIKEAKDFLKKADQIEHEIGKLEKSEEISKNIHFAYEKLYSGKGTILDELNEIQRRFQPFEQLDEKIDAWLSSLREAFYLLEDLARNIKSGMDDFVYDENLLERLSEQSDLVNKIFSKYGQNYGEVLKFYQEISKRKEFLLHLDENKEKLLRKKQELEAEMKTLAEKISQCRREGASRFEKLIAEELKSLDMTNAVFRIDFSQDSQFLPTGRDEICFMISFNKGEQLKPFSKVASGGEISRFVLSLKRVTASNDRIETMVFDEIDSGISGAAAHAVGRKLKEISREKQVICITHLPQVAANGDFHYLVAKHEDARGTTTKVKLLKAESRVNEISKMISGNEITATSLNYARELVEDAKRLSNSSVIDYTNKR